MDDTPTSAPPSTKDDGDTEPDPATPAVPPSAPRPQQPLPARNKPAAAPAPPESDEDEPSVAIPAGKECRRRGCGAKYAAGQSREAEKCIHHPGAAIFHEGSKGWSCCKRRVLEFDEFMKIEGCVTKDRHLFVGSGKKEKGGDGEEELETVRWVLEAIEQSRSSMPD